MFFMPLPPQLLGTTHLVSLRTSRSAFVQEGGGWGQGEGVVGVSAVLREDQTAETGARKPGVVTECVGGLGF